ASAVCFASRRRHTRFSRDWSSDVCSSDLDKNTVRLGAGENLYGIDEIRAFRAARPAAGLQRTLRNTVITTFGEDYAVCSTEFTREGTERIGRQQQTWVRFAYGWRIVAAQVSVMS